MNKANNNNDNHRRTVVRYRTPSNFQYRYILISGYPDIGSDCMVGFNYALYPSYLVHIVFYWKNNM